MSPLEKQTIQEKTCRNLCNAKADWHLEIEDCIDVARLLSQYLLEQKAVNTTWSFDIPGYGNGIGSLMSYIRYVDEDTRIALLRNGLDLNVIIHNGVAELTFMIGNAENETVRCLLEEAEDNQTAEQRKVWINKTDNMIRFPDPPSCCGFFSSRNAATWVRQTALQLTIAKGYTDKCGSGYPLSVSNLMLAEQLLKLGAKDQINYQEPGKGNTALHIACARRDAAAIQLLINNGALLNINNYEGETPLDMTKLEFNTTRDLLEFHTSPDGHPATFLLDKTAFQSIENLEHITEKLSDADQVCNNRV